MDTCTNTEHTAADAILGLADALEKVAMAIEESEANAQG